MTVGPAPVTHLDPEQRARYDPHMRNAFWVLSLGVIAAYGFFFALGAFAVGDVAPLSIAVGILVLLWAGHLWWESRHPSESRDPRLVQSRERRGF